MTTTHKPITARFIRTLEAEGRITRTTSRKPERNTHYGVYATHPDDKRVAMLRATTKDEAFALARQRVNEGCTIVQVCINEYGQDVAIADWGTRDGETWSVGESFLATQCPNDGCYNTITPDQIECTACHRARLEFNAAEFVLYAMHNHCAACDAPIPDEGDLCPECAQAAVPDDVKAMRPWRGLVALLVIILASPLTASAAPTGCTITGETGEGFPLATCENGSTMYQDLDGAGGYNSGLPYVVPGTWVPCEYC